MELSKTIPEAVTGYLATDGSIHISAAAARRHNLSLRLAMLAKEIHPGFPGFEKELAVHLTTWGEMAGAGVVVDRLREACDGIEREAME